SRVRELVIQAPLVLPAQGSIRVQVTVAEPAGDGGRDIVIYSRPDDERRAWTSHAVGVVAAGSGHPAKMDEVAWPSAGALALDLDGFYPALAEAGLAYGPAFQGVRAAWRRGDELFAEVVLAEGLDVVGVGLHPVLLDAALHLIGMAGLGLEGPGPFL